MNSMHGHNDADPPGIDMPSPSLPARQYADREKYGEGYDDAREDIEKTSRRGAYRLSTRAGTGYGEKIYVEEDREYGREIARDMREDMKRPDFFVRIVPELLRDIDSYTPEGKIQALNRLLDDLHQSGFSLEKRTSTERRSSQYPRGYRESTHSYVIVDAGNMIIPSLTASLAELPPKLLDDTMQYRRFLAQSPNTPALTRANALLRKGGVSSVIDDALLQDRSAIANLKTLVSQSRLSLVERTYIFSFLEDPSSLRGAVHAQAGETPETPVSHGGETSLIAHEVAKKANTMGKPIEPLTVEKFLRNPLSAVPHFFENLGFGGTLSLVGVIIASLIGSEKTWIKYPRIIMGTYLVAKGLGATDFVINAGQGHKTNNMFGKLWDAAGESLISPVTTWVKTLFVGMANITETGYERASWWANTRDYVLIDPRQRNMKVPFMDARVATLALLQESDTTKRKSLAIEKSGVPIGDYTNDVELGEARARLDALESDAREKLRKVSPNASGPQIEAQLRSIQERHTLKEYIAWIYSQSNTPEQSPPPRSETPRPPVSPEAPPKTPEPAGVPPMSITSSSPPASIPDTSSRSTTLPDTTKKVVAVDPNSLPTL